MAALHYRKGDDLAATFKVPDVYGVYQFKIDYNRMGYTRVQSATQVRLTIIQWDTLMWDTLNYSWKLR